MDDYSYDTDDDYSDDYGDDYMYLFQCLNITKDGLNYVDPNDLDYSNCSYKEMGIWGVKPPETIGESIQMNRFTQ